MMLYNYDFTFATSPEDVGMKTGATIHTMNGLNMYVRKIAKDAAPPKTNGWWEKQHLKRGLRADGKPYDTPEDAAWQTLENNNKPSTGGCPMHRP